MNVAEGKMLNVGIIGCGYWGPNLIRNLAEHQAVNLSYISDLGENRLEYARKRYRDIKTTRNYRELLNDQKLDAIVIATDVASHYKLTKDALLSDKHVLVEKPLALRGAEAKELMEIAEEKRRVLLVGHTFEYNAAVRKVKDYIDMGELGDILYIYSQRLNLGRVRRDINAMWNLAPHDISIVLFWLNEEPVQVSAHGITHLQNGIEDVVFMSLIFKNGKEAHIHTSWLDPNKVRKMTVVGSKKMIVYDDVSSDAKVQVYDKGIDRIRGSNSIGEYDDFGKFQLLLRAGDLLIPKIDFIEPLKVECSHFIECIMDRKRPLTDGYNGLRVVKVLEAGQKSLTKGGLPVDIDWM